MSADTNANTGSPDFTRGQQLGILVFVLLCGIPAMEMNGFGFGLKLDLTTSLGLAALGGVLGGALLCPRPLLAGLMGGLLAGPAGLLAVYWYTEGLSRVSNYELVLVQGAASLPGVAVGWLIKHLLKPAGKHEGGTSAA